MYLHLPINYVIRYIFPVLNPWVVLCVAVFIPTLLYYLFKKSDLSKKYLLGEKVLAEEELEPKKINR